MATNTGSRDSKGRVIYRGVQGGQYVLLASGKKKYVKATPVRRPRAAPPVANISQALARNAVARAATSTVFAARAATVRPRGMAGSGRRQGPYIVNKNQEGGLALNAVSLNRIPRGRAVKVGTQYFDSRTLRELLRRNPQATNPLTRAPFPEWVYAKYKYTASVPPALLAVATEAADMWLNLRQSGIANANYPSELRRRLLTLDDFDGRGFDVVSVDENEAWVLDGGLGETGWKIKLRYNDQTIVFDIRTPQFERAEIRTYRGNGVWN